MDQRAGRTHEGTIKDATVNVFHHSGLDSLKAHQLTFVAAGITPPKIALKSALGGKQDRPNSLHATVIATNLSLQIVESAVP
jgi:hypothetical protein